MSPSYPPLNEPPNAINDEVTWLQGAFISSLLCGVQITLSTMSFFAVLKQRMRPRLRIILLIYIFSLCAIMTAGQEVGLLFIQMGFIQDRNYPGGPNVYLSNRYSTPVDMAATCLFVFGNWMMESLLVWRCKVVCCTGDQPIWIGIIFPSALLISEYVTGSLFLHRMLQGGSIPSMINYGVAYSSLSLLLNVSVTAIIAGRLLLHRRRVVRQFGRGHGSHYASVAAVLIESASLYTLFLILVIIFFTVGTPTSNVLQQAVAQVECITTLLIIYRIAQGKGWDSGAVSTEDWRGSTQVQEEAPEVVQLENVADTAQADVHASSILVKEDGTQTSGNDNSVEATLGGEVA